MKQNKLRLGISLLLFCIAGITQAQEAITATGGDASGSGGSVSYSVGQVAYNYASNGGSVSAGVQQGYVISTVLGTENKAINLAVTVYPNPTTDYLTLSVKEVKQSKSLRFILYDTQGRQLNSKTIESSNTTIEMAELNQAIYYLNVVDSERVIKTFKIIKN